MTGPRCCPTLHAPLNPERGACTTQPLALHPQGMPLKAAEPPEPSPSPPAGPHHPGASELTSQGTVAPNTGQCWPRIVPRGPPSRNRESRSAPIPHFPLREGLWKGEARGSQIGPWGMRSQNAYVLQRPLDLFRISLCTNGEVGPGSYSVWQSQV